MSRLVSVVIAASMFAVAGCRPKQPPPPPPPRIAPASPMQVESLRALYRQHYPNCEVGVVSEAMPQNRLVSVTGLDISKMAVGQVVTFIDAEQHVLATGRIIRVVAGEVHAKYDPPQGPHEPAAGDLMIRF